MNDFERFMDPSPAPVKQNAADAAVPVLERMNALEGMMDLPALAFVLNEIGGQAHSLEKIVEIHGIGAQLAADADIHVPETGMLEYVFQKLAVPLFKFGGGQDAPALPCGFQSFPVLTEIFLGTVFIDSLDGV